MKKIFLRLGKETFGNKDIHVTFHEAFAPYFEKTNQVNLLKAWKNLSGKGGPKQRIPLSIGKKELGM